MFVVVAVNVGNQKNWQNPVASQIESENKLEKQIKEQKPQQNNSFHAV